MLPLIGGYGPLIGEPTARFAALAAFLPMKRLNRGVTILELMTTVAVVAILLGLSVPTFRSFSRNNSLTAIQNDLVTSFNLARSEALRRNRPVSVCASADGTTCGVDTDWNIGWIAFVDRSTAGVVDGTDAILNTWLSSNTELLFEGDSSFVQYRPTGMSASGDDDRRLLDWLHWFAQAPCHGHADRGHHRTKSRLLGVMTT